MSAKESKRIEPRFGAVPPLDAGALGKSTALMWLNRARSSLLAVAFALLPGWGRAGTEASKVFVMLDPGHAPKAALLTPHLRARAAQRTLLRRLPLRSTRVLRLFHAIPALALEVDPRIRAALAADPAVAAIDGFLSGHAALAQSGPLVGADIIHALGLRGDGTVVAVLDSGVDSSHPDIAGRIVAEECFCLGGCCPDGASRMSGPGSARSFAAHGPHVTGIIASSGKVAAMGLAPGAGVLAIRVIDDTLRGTLTDWIAALDWIAANRPDVHAVNMSLVSDELFAGNCTEQSALMLAFGDLFERLSRQGTAVVAASGNSGRIGRLPAPACVPGAIAVGAVTKADSVAPFTNVSQDLDLLAPGVSIRSDTPGGGTTLLSGTSMAAPHVTGTIAALAPLLPRPHLSAIEGVLMHTGPLLTDSRTCASDGCWSFPRLDATAALAWLNAVDTFLPGGGSSTLDCQVEWQMYGAGQGRRSRRAHLRCHDGDPSCDADRALGQCTFLLSVCFNVPDAHLPACDPTREITAYRLVQPSPHQPRDETDLLNAGTLLSRMPPLPIRTAAQCTDPFPLTVPRTPWLGSRSLRLITETSRGRDADRLRFTCLPPR